MLQGRRLFEPRVPRIRFQARRRAACRVVAFLQQVVNASACQRAILRIKHSVAVIQVCCDAPACAGAYLRRVRLDVVVGA